MADEIKTSDLTEKTTSMTEADWLQVSESDGLGGFVSKKIKPTIGIAKKYVCKVVQDATASALTVTAFENTIGTVNSNYVSIGIYRLNTASLWSLTKTWISGCSLWSGSTDGIIWNPIIDRAGTTLLGYYSLQQRDVDNLELRVIDVTFTYVELGSLIGATGELFLPEIRIYP